MQTALEEAESALEQEENKVVRAGLELQQVHTFFQNAKGHINVNKKRSVFFWLMLILILILVFMLMLMLMLMLVLMLMLMFVAGEAGD